MNHIEAKFCHDLQPWLANNYQMMFPAGGSMAWEAKVVRTNRFAWSQIAPHQWRALKRAAFGNFIYKISDMDRMAKPFDGFVLNKVHAYFVIYFVKSKTFYFVPVVRLADHKQISYTEPEIKKLSDFSGLFKESRICFC